MTAIVQFRTTYPVGRPPVDWVCVAPSGESYTRTQTWHRVDKIRPPENVDDGVKSSPSYQAMMGRWSVIGPKYEAWKSSNEIPDDGIALAAWSGVTPEIAEILRRQGIKSVESVAAMSPDLASKLPMPNARKLPQMAKDFLESRDKVAEQNRIADLEEQLAAMRELLEAKRGPGRPKKVEEDAA